MVKKIIYSSLSDNWRTPTKIYEELNKEFHFDDDPCPIGGGDGLERGWGVNVFVNPPYSNIRSFIDKAFFEMKEGITEVCVFLVPSRTDTKWWHECVIPNTHDIRFIKGRIKFSGTKYDAPFPSCVIVFRN